MQHSQSKPPKSVVYCSFKFYSYTFDSHNTVEIITRWEDEIIRWELAHIMFHEKM